jgi:hypothetical protein
MLWRMKRLVLLATAAALFAPAGAHAAVPCRDKIYNQWYSSGKISTNYPVACYHDALAHVPGDAQVYSNLDSDIKAALQAALAGGKGGAVGHGLTSTLSTTSQTKAAVKTKLDPHVSSAPGDPASSSSGVPVPILVLGAVALVLIVSGAAGLGVKQYRKRSTA